MAAHREAASSSGPHAAVLSQHSVAELHGYLAGDTPAREGEGSPGIPTFGHAVSRG